MTEHPKLFRNLFNLTKDDPKIPTDPDLDEDIEYLGMHMHVVWPLLKKIIKKKIWFFFRYKWKKWVKNAIITILLFVSSYYAWIKVAKPIFIKEEKTIVEEIYVTNLKSFKQLIHDVGKAESGNRWNIVSTNNMLGYFQFYTSNLTHLGINVSKEDFLNDTLLQIVTFKRSLQYNKKLYQKYINKYAGKPLPQDRRYIMTESGILMAFHLKPEAAIQYFDSGCLDISNTDGNGTNVSTYIKKFSGYKIE